MDNRCHAVQAHIHTAIPHMISHGRHANKHIPCIQGQRMPKPASRICDLTCATSCQALTSVHTANATLAGSGVLNAVFGPRRLPTRPARCEEQSNMLRTLTRTPTTSQVFANQSIQGMFCRRLACNQSQRASNSPTQMGATTITCQRGPASWQHQNQPLAQILQCSSR